MDENEITKLVLELIGNIKPIGETRHDEVSNRNLGQLIDVVKNLHVKIDDVLYSTTILDKKLESIATANKMCNNYFDWMGIEE